MSATLPLRIFLATPGDLSDEREVVKATVQEHNRRRRGSGNVEFEVVGWEQVRGTAQRPQDAINMLIRESHFMVVMFKEKWGSESGSPWGFTSGTEEELFTGLLELGQDEQPMRDVWVAFMSHASPEERVDKLRTQMIRGHSMLFEAASDLLELKEKLTARLESWEGMASTKRSRHIDLISSTGRELLKAARLRIDGAKLVDLGQPELGQAKLKEAAILGGPTENLAYSKFLARRGEFASAYDLTQIAIEQCLEDYASDRGSSLIAEALAAQASVLRLQGKDHEAVGRLKHALELVVAEDSFTSQVRSRMLDELGLAHQRLGELSIAEGVFNESLKLREEHSQTLDIGQSYVNLARLAVAGKNLAAALVNAEKAESQLAYSAPTALHANAAVLMAQVQLRRGFPKQGLPYAQRALALNQQFANRRGEAIAMLLLAQCYRASNENALATKYAQECLAVNTSMANPAGAERARGLLRELGEA